MRYAQIREFDIANGPGIRTSIFVTGCTHMCPGCFNQEYQDFNFGEEWTDEASEKLLRYLKNPVVSGLTILGGEPFQNEDGLIDLLKIVKSESSKPVWIYSGYTFEQIIKNDKKLALLKETDVLVDGLFVEALKDLKLKFRGSSNQRIIDVKKSLEVNKPVIILD